MDTFLHVGMFKRQMECRLSLHWKELLMEMLLQFGYGMMEHCRHLVEEWNGGTAVLSPRDLNGSQMQRLAKSIRAMVGGKVMLDPQFYLPHADHARLCQHDYWPKNYQTNAFWQGPALVELLTKLESLNRTLGCDVFILPGLLAAAVDDDWLETQRAIQSEAVSLNSSLPIYATIALSADAAKNNNQVARLMDESEKWPAKGYYLVFEHPNGEYLVDDGNWLANVLDITAGLKLRGAKVVMGYCNHQMLIAACAGVDALCSGTWMNVRSFPPDKFRVSYDDEIKQRATWFYCPQALSEYKIPMLDLAHRQRILDDLKPDRTFDNAYVQPLFAGAQPSSVGFTEQSAFRHYLHCLRLQAQAASQTTFDATVSAHHTLLDAVERRLKALSSAGISGQLRDFRNIIDCNRGALAAFVATRGPMLRHHWSSL
jgi:hypothetical protein